MGLVYDMVWQSKREWVKGFYRRIKKGKRDILLFNKYYLQKYCVHFLLVNTKHLDKNIFDMWFLDPNKINHTVIQMGDHATII